jgi:hypothetical protein
LHHIKPSIGVIFKNLVGAPLFFPLDGQTKGGVVLGTTITFVHKFVINMEEYKKCNIALDVKKTHIFNSREENILSQHEAWSKHF